MSDGITVRADEPKGMAQSARLNNISRHSTATNRFITASAACSWMHKSDCWSTCVELIVFEWGWRRNSREGTRTRRFAGQNALHLKRGHLLADYASKFCVLQRFQVDLDICECTFDCCV